MVQPFRYPRSLNEGFFREVVAMKERLETEVLKTGQVERNVKLGRGGIREIEFVVQGLQLLHAGRSPFLQGSQTLSALEKLKEYHLLSTDTATALAKAYCFLRDVEHRLQMEDNLQTHTIPSEIKARQRLAALMGFRTLAAFEMQLTRHTRQVREVYNQLLKSESREWEAPFPRQFRGSEQQWKKVLADHGFKDSDKSFRLVQEFANGPGYGHVSPRTQELALQLLSRFLSLCPATGDSQASEGGSKTISDPDRVVARLDSFISAYGSRAMLFEMWASNPSLFQLVLLLFDRSEFLAEMAIRTPDLVDDLVLSGRLRRQKTAAETLRDLQHGRDDPDQHLWLRRYHHAEFMRIGLRDILGVADLEQNLAELSNLADACVQYALEVVLRKNPLKKPPLVIIGLGKLGGQELSYGSDLDLLFIADDKPASISRLQRLAAEVLDLLSSPTELGIAFVTDARLRPDGEKGLLVNTFSAYEDYYRRRAQLWEIQALTRHRPIAGDLELGARFQQLAAVLTDFRPGNVARNFTLPQLEPGAAAHRETARRKKPAKHNRRRSGLAAYTPGWGTVIAQMRGRIEKERTPPGQDTLAIKTGVGGLMDAEFIAQRLCLANGWQEPNSLRALERARHAKALKPGRATLLLENYRPLRRVEGILRRWSFEGETLLPADPSAFYRVSVRCGFSSPEAFRAAVSGWRRNIRAVYTHVFSAAEDTAKPKN
jgi:glutamate-ammonia-ligase adenylyltransferase